MGTVRVLLVDDNDDFLKGVAEWINADAVIGIVATATSGAAAIEQLGRFEPDVVLIDESLPDMKITDVIRHLRSSAAMPRVVVMTFHDMESARHVKTATGADDVVTKSHVTERLLTVIRTQARERRRRTTRKPRRSEITRSES